MAILIDDNIEHLWKKTLQRAESKLAVQLPPHLEHYLISLLIQYTDKPEVAKKIFATSFLQAQQQSEAARIVLLRALGDECLLYAGLFPEAAAKRRVKLAYFVDLGRSSYAGISRMTNDLFANLATQFVLLMDVLQSIQESKTLTPIAAYEQWNELGSRRGFLLLEQYSAAIPHKNNHY